MFIIQYLWFDTNTILDHTARERAADGKTLEHSSNGVTQTQSQQLLQQRQIKQKFEKFVGYQVFIFSAPKIISWDKGNNKKERKKKEKRTLFQGFKGLNSHGL